MPSLLGVRRYLLATDPSVWNISISATVRGQASAGGVLEARVTMPIHIKRLSDDIIKDIIMLAQLPIGPTGDNDWELT